MGISTHILDTSLGKPANNVPVALWQFRDDPHGGSWHKLGDAYTDSDGRCKTLLGEHALVPTQYKLAFEVGVYFYDLHIESIYNTIEIVFTVTDPAQHYHVPLLLTANGYTTYRGS
jgi:5-hydroxyisourate hydrolase